MLYINKTSLLFTTLFPIFLARSDGEVYEKDKGTFLMLPQSGLHLIRCIFGHDS